MALTCGDLIKRARFLYGPQLAIRFEQRSFTFAEQSARMFRLANALILRQIGRGDRVAILARNCNEYVEIFGACEVAGFVAINLNSRLSAMELASICQDCQPHVLIFAKEFADVAQTLSSQIGSIRLRVGIDTRDASALSYEHILGEAPADEPALCPNADDVAYLDVHQRHHRGRQRRHDQSCSDGRGDADALARMRRDILRQGAGCHAAVPPWRKDRTDELHDDGRLGRAQDAVRPRRCSLYHSDGAHHRRALCSADGSAAGRYSRNETL